MSRKGKEHVDITDGGSDVYVDVTQPSTAMSKEEETRAESSRARDIEETPPPLYTEPVAESSNAAVQSAPPFSLVDQVGTDVRSLEIGDANETISVPMVLSNEKRSLKDFLKGRSGEVKQTVVVRKMTRDFYRKHYAKDAEGNYIGTEKPAADAGLVFVPSKSTPEDILKQVQQVAFGKQHQSNDYGGAYIGGATGGGGA